VTALVLDAGALIALDHNNRSVWAMLRVASDKGATVVVPCGAIGQAWRDGARQALLARAISHCDEIALDGLNARAAGLLCGQTATADVIDASVAITAAGMARHGRVDVLTSDPIDLTWLLAALSADAKTVTV